jgi:GNAT superfamily N-acetyltransferase
VRPAAAAEVRQLTGLFADPERANWVKEALATGRAWALVVERFEGLTRVPLGFTVTAADGETALALHVGERGRGMARETLRAAIRVLREEPFTELSASIGADDARAARAFEKAGFSPAGSCRFRGRPSTRYIRNLRGDCTPYNVWI